jgi:hypothetical protein
MSDIIVNVVMKSRDVTFFESIFPMKGKEVADPDDPDHTYSLPSSFYDPTPNVELSRSKRQRTEKSLGDDYIIYLVDEEPCTLSEAYASTDVEY